MTDFNYKKAYCVLAVPAYMNLNALQLNAHTSLIPLVDHLNQGRDLNIPLSLEIRDILNPLTCKEIAELSQACYFVGHWRPTLLRAIFPGTGWKITNICDQILRERLRAPNNVLIHDGRFRVTFSSPDCWLWEEFGLATERNLEIFNTYNLPFGSMTLHDSAEKLKTLCGDLWPDVETVPDNDLYREFLELEKVNELKKLKQAQVDRLKRIEKDIENSKIELEAFTWLINNGIDHDNCIYYSHEKCFSFGWRKTLSDTEKTVLTEKLAGFPFAYKFSANR